MLIKERYNNIIEWFKVNMPEAETELHYNNPFELLIAVILSAQCTDKRVNMVTPALFKMYPTPEKMAEAPDYELFEYIKSISYPQSKAKHLAGTARKLISDFNGEIPSDHDQLLTLPGVGRKTANVISAVIFNKRAMAVDTHVLGGSNMIGLKHTSKPTLVKGRKCIE